jgi:acyl CoA:acetate/3-ketoacid CoA transferase alpha subunit/acyl CoA:acetate/3-ketoacid CoA transferase beta subunit
MADRVQHILNGLTDLPGEDGTNKVMSADEAIDKFIKPGMTIHIGVTNSIPYGLSYELIRKFYRSNPKFEIVTLGAINHVISMIHLGMVKKIVTTYSGDPYPSPTPNIVVQNQYLNKQIEIENWSILAFTLRLMAGAMGVGFMPLNSILDSTMEFENQQNFKRIPMPFDQSRDIGVVRALNPDISIYHAFAADSSGHAIFTPPYAEEFYGAYASRDGVILSAEHIVSSNVIRKYAHLSKLPSYLVKAVVPMEFGAHPSGMAESGFAEFDGYSEDYDFILTFREAAKSVDTLDKWINEWITGLKSHEEYIQRLGGKRLLYLKGKAKPLSWIDEFMDIKDSISVSEQASKSELMTAMASTILEEKIRQNGYSAILAGIGNSNISAWLTALKLKKEKIDVELIAEVGFYGYYPRPGNPFIFNFANIPTCKILTSAFDALGLMVGGYSNKTIGIIGAGQIDKYGNVNSTRVGDVFLVGSGGGNDVTVGAKETIVVCPLNQMRFVEKVSYVTAPGKRVSTLVTDMGVFEKDQSSEFVFTRYPYKEDLDVDQHVKTVKEKTGWDVKISNNLRPIDYPSIDTLITMRLFDPKKAFL